MLPNLPSYAQQIPVQPMNPSVAAQNVAASLGRRQLIASRNEPFGVDKKSTELAQQQVDVSKEGLGLQEAMLKELSQLKEINKKMIIGSVQGSRTSSREVSMFNRAQDFASKQKKGGLASKLAAVASKGGIKGKLAAGVLTAGSGLKNFGKDIGMGALKTAVGVGGAVGLAKFGPQMLDALGLKDTLIDEDPNAAAKIGSTTTFGEASLPASETPSKGLGIFDTLKNIDKNLKESFILKNPFEKLRTTLEGGTNLVQQGFDVAKDKIVDGAEKAGNLYDTLKAKGGQYLRSVKENVLQGVTTDQGRQLAMSGEKTEGRDLRQVSQNGAISGSPRASRILSKAERDQMLQRDEDAARNRFNELQRAMEEGEDVDYQEYDRAQRKFQHIQRVRKEVEGKEGPMPEFREGGFDYTAGEGTFHTARYRGGDQSLTKVDPNQPQTMRPTEKTTGEKLKSFFKNLFMTDEDKKIEGNKQLLIEDFKFAVATNVSPFHTLNKEEKVKFQSELEKFIDNEAKRMKPGKSIHPGKARAVVKSIVKKVKGQSTTSESDSTNIPESQESGYKSEIDRQVQELEDLAKFAEQEGVTDGKLTGEQVTKFYAQRNKRDTLLNDTMENQALKENQQGQSNAPVVLNNTSKTDTTSFTPNATDPRPKNNSFERKINAVADF